MVPHFCNWPSLSASKKARGSEHGEGLYVFKCQKSWKTRKSLRNERYAEHSRS